KIPTIYAAVKDHKDKEIIVYCARGGMRSKIVASIIDSIGFKVLQVEGGYKSFRQYIKQQLVSFQLKPKIICLYGLTCTGKTQLLQEFPNSLDLEELAQHRGSLYGGVGLIPRSQKEFENLLLHRLKELNHYDLILVEGESRKVGNSEIPAFLFKAMKQGINVLVQRDFSRRAEEGAKEYFSTPEKVKAMREITPRLKEVISNKRKEDVIALIDEGKYQEATTILLKEYYDIRYQHLLKNTDYSYTVTNNDLSKAVKDLSAAIKKIKKS
ncbi:MAG: tRNA 2-selenouridine(34) synthase MnmH, partial [Nanoarchaeota archaeon]